MIITERTLSSARGYDADLARTNDYVVVKYGICARIKRKEKN